MKFYVTYSICSDLKGCYSVVDGKSYKEARAWVDKKTYGKFAFMYGEDGFKGQVKKYGLREVPLQAQVMLD